MKSAILNETELVCKLQTGCSSAFTTLYDAYSPALFGVLLRLVKDQPQAEDLLQDVFVRIWTNIHHYDAQQGRLFTWLLTLTRNVAMDAIRKRKVQTTAQAYMYDRSDVAVYATFGGMPHGSAFAVLEPKYEQILELVYQGYTKEEIANQFNLPVGTVKTRFRTAILKLQEVFRHDIYQYHLS